MSFTTYGRVTSLLKPMMLSSSWRSLLGLLTETALRLPTARCKPGMHSHKPERPHLCQEVMLFKAHLAERAQQLPLDAATEAALQRDGTSAQAHWNDRRCGIVPAL